MRIQMVLGLCVAFVLAAGVFAAPAPLPKRGKEQPDRSIEGLYELKVTCRHGRDTFYHVWLLTNNHYKAEQTDRTQWTYDGVWQLRGGYVQVWERPTNGAWQTPPPREAVGQPEWEARLDGEEHVPGKEVRFSEKTRLKKIKPIK